MNDTGHEVKNDLSEILFNFKLKDLDKILHENTIIITDDNVFDLYASSFEDHSIIKIRPGEEFKSLDSIEEIVSQLIDLNADRDCLLVGLGGGVVCDITGLTASIYMRGVKHSLIPTTLLAQIDASIGGKTGVNLSDVKNVIGTFKQAEVIYISNEFLKTLSIEEIYSGLAEMLKTSVISDKEMYNRFKTVIENLDLFSDVFNKLKREVIQSKVDIVKQDEKESGLRRILNFGHTFGHAYESLYKLPHGQAVLHGMKTVLKLSEKIAGLDKIISSDIEKTIDKLLTNKDLSFDKKKVLDNLINDKKRYSDFIKLVLLKDISEPIVSDIKIDDLKECYYDLC